jgi:hypothetical protein
MFFQEFDLLREALGMANVIGIHAGDVSALGVCQSGVQRARYADVRFFDQPDAIILCCPMFGERCAFVRGRIVYQQ